MYPTFIQSRIFIFSVLFFTACQPENTKKSIPALTLADDLGRKITLARPPQRVMALAPSVTELLFYICDTAQIIAVTQNDDFPAGVKTKKVINNYPTVDVEAVLQAKPDLIFSLEGMTSTADAQRLAELGSPVYYQKCEKVSDVLRCIRDIGAIMGQQARANRIADSLQEIQTRLEAQTQHLPHPKVLAITYANPIYVYGKNTILTDKLRIAGADNAVDSVFAVPFPVVSPEYILQLNPDVIIGGSFGKMDSTFFSRYPVLKHTKAYRNKKVFAVTDDFNSRPGIRVMNAVLELKNILHPTQK